jgi:predicted nucleic acid-binding protein
MTPRRVTIDASVVLRWTLDDEADRIQATRLRDELAAGELDPIEPGHFLLEVAAGLERAQRAGRLAVGDSRVALNALEVVFIDRTDPFAAAATSLEFALELGIRVADAAYLECARRASTTLVTADRRLARACSQSGVPVVALADMPPL